MKSNKEILESYSNLAYNLAGLYAFVFQGDLLFCFALQALGCASFVYHWNKTRPIFLFDWWAMAFVVTILAGQVANTAWVWYAIIAYQVLYSYFVLGRFNVYFEVGLSVAPTLLIILIVKGWLIFGIVAAIFLFALWIRSKDEDPTQAKFHDSIAHSLWHVLTAIGFPLARYL